MKNNIEKYNNSIENKFREDKFFKDVLVTCYEKKLLSDNTLAKIYYERMELLKEKLKYYTRDDSSSVMVEAAESILESIDYTIGIYLKTFNNIDFIIQELKNSKLSYMLKMGHTLIKNKILQCKNILNNINENKLKVYNYSYDDTIDYGIPLFFKEYDDFFQAQETQGSIDYQLYMDNTNYAGVEYMYNYLYTLSLENDFCNKFSINDINQVLKGYDKKCELLLINIFELVLINSLGIIICGKDLTTLNISDLDRKIIKNKLEKLYLEELEKELLKDAKICSKILKIKNEALIDYINKATLKIASFIKDSLKLNKLEKVFISYKENEDKGIIEYTDGEKMKNSQFKSLSEEIRECSLVKDKISLIKNNIKSLEDLLDMLNADCLFEDEYIKYFKSLSKMDLVLLSKCMSELSNNGEYEKDAYLEFNKYISSLSKEEQREISDMKEKIKL